MAKAKAKAKTPAPTCGECIHYAACAAWNVGDITNALAKTCANYEQPVRGRWDTVKDYSYGDKPVYECSECGGVVGSVYGYCPYCGARMEADSG